MQTCNPTGRAGRAMLIQSLRVLACMLALFTARAQAEVDTIYSFSAPDGNELSALVDGGDGNFYATARSGGARNVGGIVRVSGTGQLKLLYSFDGTKGQNPVGGLALGQDGALYGSTSAGGAAGYGTAFRITRAGVLSTLHDYTLADGGASNAPLLLGKDGAFYGVTAGDFTNTAPRTFSPKSYGAVFRITSNGTFKVLHAFDGTGGSHPLGGLVQATNGTLYGTTSQVIDNSSVHPTSRSWGTVFSIAATGNAFRTLHTFQRSDGGNPLGKLLLDSAGTLWGTTSYATEWMSPGTAGTVFKIDASGTFTSLYTFTSSGAEGYGPVNGLARGSDGNFYGTTERGAANGLGAFFRITPAGSLSKLYAFQTLDGRPSWTLTENGSDPFIGTGSTTGFTLDRNGTLTQYVRVGYTTGAQPRGRVLLASDGNYYGVVSAGGYYGYGGVFRASPSGVIKLLLSFSVAGQGAGPLVEGRDGALYTAAQGSGSSTGSVLRITKAGSISTRSAFPDSSRGYLTNGEPLLSNSDGSLIGVTDSQIFSVSATGQIVTVAPANDGFLIAPIYGADRLLYGASQGGAASNYQGSIYRINTSGIQFVHVFTGGSEGSAPAAPLLLARDGNFYGTTTGGGDDNSGTVFRLTPDGTLTTLHSFLSSDPVDGYYPSTALVEGANGVFYGNTLIGGASGAGNAFRITSTGAYTSLGAIPNTGNAGDALTYPSEIVVGSDNGLYGTLQRGGAWGAGAIFEVTP